MPKFEIYRTNLDQLPGQFNPVRSIQRELNECASQSTAGHKVKNRGPQRLRVVREGGNFSRLVDGTDPAA